MTETTTGRGTTLLTLERGLDLLEAVAAADGNTTAKMLSRSLGLKIGTCYHLLRTLVGSGHLVRMPGGRYDIGPRSASLSRHLQRRSGPSPELAVILTRLHNKTQETAYLAGWHHGALVLQHYLTGRQALRVANLDVGYASHMHARASCKAVLAFLPHEQVSALFNGVELAAITAKTVTDLDELFAELAAVRRQGHAIDDEEFEEGISCVAAPFFTVGGDPAGAFTVAAPTTRFVRRKTHLITEVREAAAMATGLLRTGRLSVPSCVATPAPPVRSGWPARSG
ncbi:IclR family transcriptional regulator [Kutzneria sp. CA-103260]|uniref:IclR family transcriptional regulator n=1 Tax=Kutzneria sp. CA-103260 TaxID=2802641 RepID=UPI001BA6F200|nr:IclR family transcriptional regulator [Kutzneria sp. CA-103260]QUQ68857.1 transcriptional regulator for glyoxylate bypass [Kutzneria sp. CA-103260]